MKKILIIVAAAVLILLAPVLFMSGLIQSILPEAYQSTARILVHKPHPPADVDAKTIEMLWRGIWCYVKHHRIDAMIGCASLEGIDQEKLAPQLSFLFHHAKAAPEWLVSPLPQRFVPMNRLRKEQIEAKRALAALPPLVKGYMRVGARFGEGAVVDRQFGVTDVFVVMPICEIEGRYIEYFGSPEDLTRRAA